MAWRREQTRDRFFQRAKHEHYRARSAYKLIEINRRFKLFKRGDTVLDLGAAPGSWSQVAAEVVGPGGRVIAVDLTPIEPIPGVTTIQADVLERLPQLPVADAVLSDVSPRVSGNRVVDHARSIELADASLAIATAHSRPGASFVVKVFRGEDFDAFVARVRRAYRAAKVVVPEATRQESREAYVVGLSLLRAVGPSATAP
jgi:23S rRNA (uridine2552-2'-O)-methyltransferase